MIDKTRVLLFEEEGLWVAQCLEHDLAVQGRDLGQVEQRLRRAAAAFRWMARRLGADPFRRTPAAAASWFARFEAATKRLPPWVVAPQEDAVAHEFQPAICKAGGRDRRGGAWRRGKTTAAAFMEVLCARGEVETIVYAEIGPVLERVAARDIVRAPFDYSDDEVLTPSVVRSVCTVLMLPPMAFGVVPVLETSCVQ